MVLPRILPGAEHLIAYHVVIEGQCYGNIIGEAPIAVGAREVIVFTRGDPHVMASDPGMRADPVTQDKIDAVTAGQLPFYATYGAGDGPVTKVVCGFLACDSRPFNPLLDTLPPVIKVGDPEGSDQGWLGQFIRFAIVESAEKRAGGESVLAKLSELMFIEVIRRYIETLPPEQSGWLAGLRDPFIGKALAQMHRRPAHDWSLEELAREVGSVPLGPCRALRRYRRHARRCNISRNGGCRSRRGYSPKAAPTSPPSPTRSATIPKPRSAAPSRRWSACHPRCGAAAPAPPPRSAMAVAK